MKGRTNTAAPDEATAQVLARAQPEMEALCGRIEPRFRRVEVRQRLRRYLAALLGPLPRKNGWQIAEQVGERSPDGVQEMLNAAKWDANAVRDDLRAYVIEHLGDPEGVLVVDETGFLKKGTQSVGVARQYSGTAGRVENCQIGVFLTYATPTGRTFLDRELYLPREWTTDPARCRKAGVPESVAFATKPQLAQRMLSRALSAGVPCSWVTGDSVYGGDRALRRFLEEQEQPYVLAVRGDEVVCPDSEWLPVRSGRVDQLAARLPAGAWERHSCGAGEKGPRLYDWAWLPLWQQNDGGFRRWLLVRRSMSDPTKLAYYRVFGRVTTTLSEAVRVAGSRWSVEESFEMGKGLVGLDQYEVRRWEPWYRYLTLSMLAHAFLCVLRARTLTVATEPPAAEPLPFGKGGSGSPRPAAHPARLRRNAPTTHRAGGASLGVQSGLGTTGLATARLPLVGLASPPPGAGASLSLPSPSYLALQ
jgi:SRSO17 transposase